MTFLFGLLAFCFVRSRERFILRKGCDRNIVWQQIRSLNEVVSLKVVDADPSTPSFSSIDHILPSAGVHLSPSHGDILDVLVDRVHIYDSHQGIGIDWRRPGAMRRARGAAGRPEKNQSPDFAAAAGAGVA